jgi:hypothetical protein
MNGLIPNVILIFVFIDPTRFLSIEQMTSESRIKKYPDAPGVNLMTSLEILSQSAKMLYRNKLI